jgi:hypothetical protein
VSRRTPQDQDVALAREFMVRSWRLSCRARVVAGKPVHDPDSDIVIERHRWAVAFWSRKVLSKVFAQPSHDLCRSSIGAISWSRRRSNRGIRPFDQPGTAGLFQILLRTDLLSTRKCLYSGASVTLFQREEISGPPTSGLMQPSMLERLSRFPLALVAIAARVQAGIGVELLGRHPRLLQGRHLVGHQGNQG